MIGWLFYCCKSAIVKSMLSHGGSGIGGVVVVVVMVAFVRVPFIGLSPQYS